MLFKTSKGNSDVRTVMEDGNQLQGRNTVVGRQTLEGVRRRCMCSVQRAASWCCGRSELFVRAVTHLSRLLMDRLTSGLLLPLQQRERLHRVCQFAQCHTSESLGSPVDLNAKPGDDVKDNYTQLRVERGEKVRPFLSESTICSRYLFLIEVKVLFLLRE